MIIFLPCLASSSNLGFRISYATAHTQNPHRPHSHNPHRTSCYSLFFQANRFKNPPSSIHHVWYVSFHHPSLQPARHLMEQIAPLAHRHTFLSITYNIQERKRSRVWPATSSSRASESLSALISMVRACGHNPSAKLPMSHTILSSSSLRTQCLSIRSPRSRTTPASAPPSPPSSSWWYVPICHVEGAASCPPRSAHVPCHGAVHV